MRWWKWLIIIGIEILLLEAGLLTWLVWDKSYLWFVLPLILIVIGDLVTTIIILIIKAKAKQGIKTEIDVKEAKKIAINEMKYDDDNPDNFSIQQQKIFKIGEVNSEKTPILVLCGKGTENNDSRFAIVNLKNPSKEMSFLINPSKEEVIEAISKLADHPPDEIREEIKSSLDEYGRPITTRIVKKQSHEEVKKQEEKKDAEEKGGI